ncbi:MAG: gluconeogenesis factor YvcK family protein [Psychrobium sp.]
MATSHISSPITSKLSTTSPFDKLEHIVAIGGGHGLGRVLSSLSHLEDKLTGIVTTTDNGGSTGRLREAENCIAWGDLRNCINQLTTRPTIARQLFEYRFKGNGDLAEHNLGNLMLLAMDQMSVRPLDAINLIREMLDVKSHIIPMSEQPTHLVAVSQTRQRVFGETHIDEMAAMPQSLLLEPKVNATPEAIDAIRKAQLLIIGPGSLLTSIMPPLIMPEIQQAIAQSKAKKIFITNLIAENSPAGHISKSALLKWSTDITQQAAPDAILINSACSKVKGEYYYRDIASKTSPYHDREKLKAALIDVYNELSLAQMSAIN